MSIRHVHLSRASRAETGIRTYRPNRSGGLGSLERIENSKCRAWSIGDFVKEFRYLEEKIRNEVFHNLNEARLVRSNRDLRLFQSG
jgi:hypothetical protein